MDTGPRESEVGGRQVGPLCQMCVMTLRTSRHTGEDDNCKVEGEMATKGEAWTLKYPQ